MYSNLCTTSDILKFLLQLQFFLLIAHDFFPTGLQRLIYIQFLNFFVNIISEVQNLIWSNTALLKSPLVNSLSFNCNKQRIEFILAELNCRLHSTFVNIPGKWFVGPLNGSLWGCHWAQVKQQQPFYCPQYTMTNFMIMDNKEKTDLYSDWAHLISGLMLGLWHLLDPGQVCGHCLWYRNKHFIIGTRRRWKVEHVKAAISLLMCW